MDHPPNNEPITEILWSAHQTHLVEELGSEEAMKTAIEYGARSITEEEAKAQGFRIKGPDGTQQTTSGILFPFDNDFAHLRCDEVPRNSNGDHCKYLAKAGSKFGLKQFGKGDPVVATEGWKDALRIHLDTGESTIALPSITGWKLLPESIQFIIYDADAAHNPHVWGQLVRAGIHLKSAQIGFWDRKVAGDKGGACEYFGNQGLWEKVTFTRPRHLVREIYKGWTKDLRADFIQGNIRKLMKLADELNFNADVTESLLNQAAGKLGIRADHLKRIRTRYLSAKKRLKQMKGGPLEIDENGLPEEPEKQDNPHFAHERVVLLLPYFKETWRADYELEKAWLHYTGRHWESAHSNDPFNRALEDVYDEIGWAIRDSATVRCDRDGLRRALGGELDSPNTKLIPFSNGCLNLNSLELLPHDPTHCNRYSLPFSYDHQAPEPKKILSFLNDRLEHPEVVALFRAFCWHVLSGRPMKCFLEVTGPANTGKSVLIELLHALVGSQNCAATSLQRLEDTSNRFETYKLRGKRLILCSESQGYVGQLEMLKAITGRDLITAERKNSTATVDFYFLGGVVLSGNAPVRPSDKSAAVVNRRRSIRITKVVEARNERQLLERDGSGGYVGELASELGGFAKWILEMDPAEARKSISRDILSLARAKAEKEVLLQTDSLAQWANECLVFDQKTSTSVGRRDDFSQHFLLPNYLSWYEQNVGGRGSYSQSNFKTKLVTLLRDVLEAPLPAGDHSRGAYRKRGVGSVVPYVRIRHPEKDSGIAGVVDWAFHKRITVTTGNDSANSERPVGNDRNKRNGYSSPPSRCEVALQEEREQETSKPATSRE